MEEKNRRRIIRTMTRRGRDEILSPIEDDTISNWDAENANLPHNEFERRRTEFLLMRKIQQQASTRRKWLAMATSLGVWILLWLIGAVIFVSAEKPYGQWDYFDGFYFCFISLMTIGYGDLTPASNAGKSFFVFWSLLALPTMTVLISNAGDTVVKFVKDATIRVGNITILPGEDGFTGNVKYVANQLSFGFVFRSATSTIREYEEERRKRKRMEGIIGFDPQDAKDAEKQQNEYRSSSGSPARQAEDEERQEKHKSRGEPQPTNGGPSLSQIQDRFDELPTGTELHLLLIKEIQNVCQHLREADPRRYTFEEWAWYLALIGEDERDPLNHRKVMPKAKHHRHRTHKHKRHHHHHGHDHGKAVETHDPSQFENDETIAAPRPSMEANPAQRPSNDSRLTWSWVGNRSPLMGGQEESEWILEKLTERLQESLWETKIDEDDAKTP
jgi:potassium channel subfamily K